MLTSPPDPPEKSRSCENVDEAMTTGTSTALNTRCGRPVRKYSSPINRNSGIGRKVNCVACMNAHIASPMPMPMPMPMPQLARQAGLSTRQLERLFRAHLNTSPGRHYLSLRLDLAHQLVAQSALSMSEIALAAGGNASRALGRAFKARFGLAPGGLRAANRSAGASWIAFCAGSSLGHSGQFSGRALVEHDPAPVPAAGKAAGRYNADLNARAGIATCEYRSRRMARRAGRTSRRARLAPAAPRLTCDSFPAP
ncbi:MAG: helix-turn-helix domain-containing protein [Rhodobacteraceae bacterium]|nr:helix-turn-helix domain-containing protein [Paracoccaceae bacterium]